MALYEHRYKTIPFEILPSIFGGLCGYLSKNGIVKIKWLLCVQFFEELPCCFSQELCHFTFPSIMHKGFWFSPLSLPRPVTIYMHSTWNQIQGLVHARQALNYTCSPIIFCIIYLFIEVQGFELRALMRQVLYHLSHALSSNNHLLLRKIIQLVLHIQRFHICRFNCGLKIFGKKFCLMNIFRFFSCHYSLNNIV
jgi:hypothetical protein